ARPRPDGWGRVRLGRHDASPAYDVRIKRTSNITCAQRPPVRTVFATKEQCAQAGRNLMETRSSHRWWILVVLCLSSLVLVVDGMALTVAVPQMTRDIGATAQDTQWILDSYVLVFAGLLLTSGSLGDRF